MAKQLPFCCGLLFFAGIESVAASPQNASVCDQALVRSTYNSFSADKVDARLSTLVTEETGNKLSHDVGANVVIYGTPYGGSWKDFNENLKRSLASATSSLTRDQMLNIMWTGLDPTAASAYSDCLNAMVLSSNGLHLAVRSATSKDIAILARWVPNINDPKKISVTWTGIKKDVHGKALPKQLGQGETIIIIERPKESRTIAVNHTGFGDSVVVQPLPPIVPPKTCISHSGPHNFFGDHCGDQWQVPVGSRVLEVTFGQGGSTTIPKNNPTYNASLGSWLAGDFNVDGLTDLAHLVHKVPGVDPYVHIHRSKGKGLFEAPTAGFNWRQAANPQKDYDANLGDWTVRDVDGDGRDDLVHDPKTGAQHIWYSNGNGTFTLR